MGRRKALKYGLSISRITPFHKLYGLDKKKWVIDWEHKIQGVLYNHGTAYSGAYAHGNLAKDNFCSAVMGHLHTNAGTIWAANKDKIYFGLAVGCGIDHKSYAMAYAKQSKKKYMLGCGVVTENGRYPQFVPMKL